MIDNGIANTIAKPYNGKITKVSKTLQQNYSETVTNENYKEILKEKYASPANRQEIIDQLRLE